MSLDITELPCFDIRKDTQNPSRRYGAFDFQQRLAAFLLVRSDYSFFGHGWITDMPPVWYPEWDWEVGVPLSNMTRSGNTFSRSWSKGNVSLNCDTFAASFTFKAAIG